ncbi:hypothetical protein GNZ06_07755 [Aeromonas jandaei]|nr:hypothetical protein [Aeromonas jandaei]MBM0490777.1 hypothetical protein [Aeromonas jandaei]MBM0568689.1 hypothetical protein [Aeromonas jandaei]
MDVLDLLFCTAHPAKFKESVDEILNLDVPLPGPLAKHAELPLLSVNLPGKVRASGSHLYHELLVRI